MVGRLSHFPEESELHIRLIALCQYSRPKSLAIQ